MRLLDISYKHNPLHRDRESFAAFRERYLGYLRHWAQRHEIVHVECSDWQDDWQDGSLRQIILRKNPGVFWWPLSLHRRLKREPFDAILVHGMRSPLQLLALRLAFSGPRRPKIAVLHHAEQPSSGAKAWLQTLADRWAVDHYFFAAAENAQAWLAEGIIEHPTKIHEVMEISSHFQAQNCDQCRLELGLPVGEKIALWVGRLHPVKDPLTVVRGFGEFLKTGGRARLYMIFQENDLLPDVQRLLSANPQLAEHTVLIGKIPHPALETWFSAADAFVLGSRYEGSGTALAEAMSCGCWPVVSDIAAFRSITGRGAAGSLFEPGNASDFAHALATTFARTEDRRAIVRCCFEENLSWQAIAERMLAILKADKI